MELSHAVDLRWRSQVRATDGIMLRYCKDVKPYDKLYLV